VRLGLIAVVSFPIACVIYGIFGLLQRSFSVTNSRMMGTVATATGVLAIAAIGSPGGIAPLSVLVWGGNLVYLGALMGWAVSDSLRS
jgi:hypothetical protein